MDLFFVRELTAEGDLVLAFALDGSPVWALDRDSGLQWWFSDTDRAEARQAIDEQWPTFATMPITAASYAGPHPAWELRRQAAGAAAPIEAAAPDAEHPITPWLRGLRDRFLGLSSAGQLLVAAGTVVASVVLVSWLLSPFAAAPRPAGDAGSGAPVAGQRCELRGDIAEPTVDPATVATAEQSEDSEGALLVCAPSSRALSAELIWRSTG